jgi:hypothetical protein
MASMVLGNSILELLTSSVKMHLKRERERDLAHYYSCSLFEVLMYKVC